MNESETSLDDLILAVCDGTPVDWESAIGAGDEQLLQQIPSLRLVAAVAAVAGPRPAPARADRLEPENPVHWNRLQILGHIGSGGFGDVYRAWDPALDREVALKLLRTTSDRDAQADEAVDEGRLLARVRHPNIVSVYGAARAEGRVGIWMEYIRGRTLTDIVRSEGPMPAKRLAALGVDLCDAVAAVHRAHLLHRDIKAQNVMLAEDGRVVLMDFGAGGDVRHAGLDVTGTPRYLAPELARGVPASARSDIYSLGVLLRYALTGRFDEAADVITSTDRMAAAVLDIAARATDANPEQRFESAHALGVALRAVVTPRARPYAVLVATMAGALLATLLGVGFKFARLQPVERSDLYVEAWRTAVPHRARLTADQISSVHLWGFSAGGVLSGTGIPDKETQTLMTVNLRTSETRSWTSSPSSAGYIESTAACGDGTRVAEVWYDLPGRHPSLRVVDRSGGVRVLMNDPNVRALWIRSWEGHRFPALIAKASGEHQLAVVDADSGDVRPVASVERDPLQFDLSPDGRFLAFDTPQTLRPGAPKRIVVVDVASGRQWPLTAHSTPQAFPAWAPAGDRLFYISSDGKKSALRAVSVVDGRSVGSPATLRDDLGRLQALGFVAKETLAYLTAPGPADVFVATADSTGAFRRAVERVSDGSGYWPAWSPDGRAIAWTDTYRIWVRELATGTTREYPSTRDRASILAWSPNGRRLAYWSEEQLSKVLAVLDLDSGDEQEIWSVPWGMIGWPYNVTWMADSKEILFTTDNRRIIGIDVSTRKEREVYSTGSLTLVNYIFVAPGGHSLFVEEGRGERWFRHVVALDPRGTDFKRPLPADNGIVVGWHPDGRSVIESRSVPSDAGGEISTGALWQVPLDGSPQQFLLKGANLIYASMAPDGRRLAYGTHVGFSAEELWTLTPTTTQH